MAATSEQRRAAVVRRLKAEGPQPLVFRSGVDIDAVHYRLGAVTSIPQGGFNRDSSAGCRSSDTRARRPRRVDTGGQQLPPPKVAAPDDRPHGQTAGAAPDVAGTASGRQMVDASPAAVGAAPHSVGQRTEGEAA